MDGRSDLANVIQAMPPQRAGQFAPVAMPGHQPIGPMIAQQLARTPQVGRREPAPLQDSFAWNMAKNAALVGFVAMAVFVALEGDENILVTASYAATAFLAIVMFVLADRMRFIATYGQPGDVEVVMVRTDRQDAVVGGYAPIPNVHVTHVAPPAAQPSQTPFRVNVT